MLYVQQSLTSNEEILREAHFHYMYTVTAVFWIIFGATMAIAIGYGAIWLDISAIMRSVYPDLPSELFNEAWGAIITERGGYLNILWEQNPLVRFAMLGSFILGIFFFAHMMIVKATTEIAVTNERLIYKHGLIARDVMEISIDRIEGVNVRQGILGRLLGYGRISARGMGVGEVILPRIEKPIMLKRAIDEAQNLHGRDKSEPEDKTENDF